MKITRNHLKELIKQSVVEAEDWWNNLSSAEKSAYIKKHPKSKKAQDAKKEKGKEKMVRNAAGDMVPANTVAGHPDFKKDDKPHPGERDPSVRASREKPSDDSGGPSYANVPKGAKSTKQAKLMNKNNDVAKKIGFKNIDDVFSASASDIDDFIEEIPDVGQDFDKAIELMNVVRDNEQGMRDDDDDTIDDFKNKVKKILNTPGGRGEKGSGKSNKETGDEMMSAADAANAKMDAAEKAAKKKSKKESVKESKPRRFTVKEVRKWMKTLEENRYKKVYNSDARRVAWLANNNLSEDYESMPISMRKKWSKSAYGRERYLAKEFLQSQRLREAIRKELKKQIRG